MTCNKDLTWEATGLDVSNLQDEAEITITIRQGSSASQKNGLLLELTVTKDTLEPTVSLDSPSAINTNNQSQYTLGGECSKDEQTVSVTIGDLYEGADQTVDCASLAWTLEVDVSALTTDTVIILVDSTDAVGNPALQVLATVDRDVVAPMVTLTSTDLTITAANHTNYSLEGTCDSDFDVVFTLGILDSGTLTTETLASETLNCTNSGTWSLINKDVSTLGDNTAITLRVEQQDASENVGFVENVILKDTVHPAPALTSSLFINAANVGSYSLQGDCEGIEDVSITVGSQSPTSTPCSSGQWTYSVDSSLSEDSYVLTIAQEDTLGNEGVLTPAPTLIKDVTLPSVGLDSNQEINAANAANYRPQGSCNEVGTVTITVASLPSATAPCNNGSSSWQVNPGIDVSGLPDAPSITISLSMQDLAGNASNATATVSKDITSRAVAINAPAIINAANENNYAVSGTCSQHTDAMSLTVGGLSPSTEPSCSGGTWSANVDVSSLADGNSVAINIGFGTGGAQVTDSETTSKDTGIPTVVISSFSDINEANQSNYTLSGTCSENGQSVAVAIEGLNTSLNTQAPCNSGSWEVTTYDVSSLSGSSITLTADLSDVAGQSCKPSHSQCRSRRGASGSHFEYKLSSYQ